MWEFPFYSGSRVLVEKDYSNFLSMLQGQHTCIFQYLSETQFRIKLKYE